MVAEITASLVFLMAVCGEWLHARRIVRVAPLAFGPGNRARNWTRLFPPLRVLALTLLGWGLTSLLLVAPRSYRPQGELAPGKEQHLLIVFDVSPSMRLKDAGPRNQERRQARCRDLMRSFFDRIPVDQYRVSVIAVFSGAKPVVVDSKDLDVVDAILADLPLHQAFEPGDTRLLEGIREASKIAKPWNPASTTLILLTDGDTVPPQGMPTLPASIGQTLIVGVGDPNHGSFIAGRQSKQDVFALRQIAARLGGTYHDGNTKHVPSELIAQIVRRGEENQQEPWSRREYALLAISIGSILLAFLPWLLHHWGTSYLPGVRRFSTQEPHSGISPTTSMQTTARI